MAAEENEHRRRLIDLFVAKFGEHIPLIRRQDIKGYIAPQADLADPARSASTACAPARRRDGAGRRALLPPRASQRATDAAIRKLLGDLAEAEDKHEHRRRRRSKQSILTADARHDEDEHARRRFILQIIQPGLVGLMDGSVSTLAPVFAAAFATRNPWNAFLVGLAASLGAGISMGFAEALADDGKLSGRGAPLLRGLVCGLMTMAGGIGHTLPYLIPNFVTATVDRLHRRRHRTGGDRLDPVALHGHAAALGGGQGHARRRAGARRRHPDRQQLSGRHRDDARRPRARPVTRPPHNGRPTPRRESTDVDESSARGHFGRNKKSPHWDCGDKPPRAHVALARLNDLSKMPSIRSGGHFMLCSRHKVACPRRPPHVGNHYRIMATIEPFPTRLSPAPQTPEPVYGRRRRTSRPSRRCSARS